ncbi:hypothetical protein EVAR_92168_1 [Eumeta japonica]|uniref:Uncharacterized protein n=1 Tax=Eumeta variegata TaxID=151549 RepID=A0A4C1SZB1_EUMVA|nr:hypothetical protein EVAR_92168_1 [Eumeta japonica]
MTHVTDDHARRFFGRPAAWWRVTRRGRSRRVTASARLRRDAHNDSPLPRNFGRTLDLDSGPTFDPNPIFHFSPRLRLNMRVPVVHSPLPSHSSLYRPHSPPSDPCIKFTISIAEADYAPGTDLRLRVPMGGDDHLLSGGSQTHLPL